MDHSEFTKAFINKYYDGNVQEFEVSRAKTDAEKKVIKQGRLEAISWKKIDELIQCHPEYELKALMYIESHLGYLPKPQTYMPHESSVRSLIATYEKGRIPEEHFFDEFLFYCKRIRNDDMKKYQRINADKNTEKDFKEYHSYLSLYKVRARERLTAFLGIDPDLEYSLDAEKFLRQLLRSDAFYNEMPFCEVDYRAATIYKYKEALSTEGEAAADDLIPAGIMFRHERI